ncbi:MAG TPA: DHH family phosphoesterase [Candidatus Limnocylindrales bacterium]|nr:DHH family phosphoesterase [Candidatus Limnocylindrales bacterium]
MSGTDPVRQDTSLTATDLAAVPQAVVERLRGARDVLTVCHENPEADALGAALAVALLLEQLGGRATPVCADPVPRMYRFMPHIERFRQAPEAGRAYDLLVVVDCGELERIGPVLTSHADLFERTPILDIDHHKSNPGFGALDWIDPAAAATCEMVTLLVRVMGVPLAAVGGALAANLLAGVVIDTANFQHPNTTPRTLRVAAELLAAGAPLADTARLLYRSKPDPQLKLFGRVLARLESAAGGRIVWSSLSDDDLEAAGAEPAHSEGLIDLLSQAETAEVAILFKAVGKETRASVRTREGGVDATVLTGAFGGGGHARAAGATVSRPLAEAIPAVLAEAERLVAALPLRGDTA